MAAHVGGAPRMAEVALRSKSDGHGRDTFLDRAARAEHAPFGMKRSGPGQLAQRHTPATAGTPTQETLMSRTTKPTTAALAACLTGVLALAACGGGGGF